MDVDIAELSLVYLLKAREWVVAGREHHAITQLGLCPEAITALRRVPLVRLLALARANGTLFTLRVPAQFWRDLAQESPDEPLSETLLMHLQQVVTAGDSHDAVDPPA